MPNQNTINTLEEALRIFWLENSQDADLSLSEKELKLILSSPDNTFDMNETKRVQLVNKLFETVNNISLGQLISEACKSKKINEQALAQETKLPIKILEELKADLIFPNNIPILLLKGLFNKLNISFNAAEKAILKTFEIIQKKEFISLENNPLRMSFRKRQSEAKESFIKKGGKSDGKELYENKDSLMKYLSKLEELMRNENQ